MSVKAGIAVFLDGTPLESLPRDCDTAHFQDSDHIFYSVTSREGNEFGVEPSLEKLLFVPMPEVTPPNGTRFPKDKTHEQKEIVRAQSPGERTLARTSTVFGFTAWRHTVRDRVVQTALAMDFAAVRGADIYIATASMPSLL